LKDSIKMKDGSHDRCAIARVRIKPSALRSA
jgi:hypothetical protein